MKYLMIIIAFLSFSFPSKLTDILNSSTSSIGLSETMGFYGFLNRNFHINDNLSITVGTLGIIGGAGLAWRHSFNDRRISPFLSGAAFGAYMLPVMCSTDNCKTKHDLIFSGSLGLDMHAIKTKKINIHLQIGVMSLYSVGEAPADSPSNIPGLWPIINIKFQKPIYLDSDN